MKTAKATVVSPRFSLKNWNALTWLLGNWSTIKEVLKVGLPLLLGMELFQTNPFLIGLVTLAGKFVLDVGEYFVKEYKE